MKKALLFFLICPALVYSQNELQGGPEIYQYFDGNDTIPEYTLEVLFNDSTNPDSVWQIGRPQKLIFDTASTAPNVLVTDTIGSYPINSNSWFELDFPEVFLTNALSSGGILAIQWMQKLDLDTSKDGGLLEFSIDSGTTWQNAFDNPYTYNYYGWISDNVDTIGTDTLAFTGTDTTWRNVWLCFNSWYLYDYMDGFKVRFKLFSDSIATNQEGWMIDNMMCHITYVHTVGENEQEEYLKVYPNPSTGRVHIQAQKQKTYHIIEKLEVFNSAGQLVQAFEKVPTKFFVDLDDQPDGSYYVRVQTNFETQTFPIILQKE